jgi:putative oxidoreductase
VRFPFTLAGFKETMKALQRFLRLDFLPGSADCGLLVLRLWLGISLLALHGWGKLTKFQDMAGAFPDPLGVGSKASVSLALVGEVVAPLLIILGLYTRLGALMSGTTMAVAFFLQHKGVLKGPGSGELAFIYLAGFIALLAAGGGRFAVDGKSGKGRSDGNGKSKR